MAKVANLNQFRKQQARGLDQARADENAVRFGQSKAGKDQAAAVLARAKRDLDGHEVER